MTSEQLQHARAERWHQVGNPLLTAEETRSWIESAGLCLFAPRRAHFAAPAPSLVEAVAGMVTDAPTRETVETAAALVKRLAADAAVVPLNLFGAAGAFGSASGFGGGVGAGAAGFGGVDLPDFVMAREVLPYVFSLIGGRNWKSGPGDKASPLMVEVWKLLRDAGTKTAAEIQTALGREVTETAVLRALGELWHGLRVVPAYGDETRWEVTQARFAAEMTASQKVAQTTALSALVSLYLDGVVAAEREEIEVFLSPLTARSRVREVVNGMQATRQLEIVSVGAHPLLHVTGSLPEMATVETAEPEVAAEKIEMPEAGGAAKSHPPFRQTQGRPFTQKRREGWGTRPPFEKREREERPGGFARRERGGSKPFREAREDNSERRPFEKKRFEKKPFEKKPFGEKRFEGGREGFEKKRFGRQGRPFEKGASGKRHEEGKERPYRGRGEGGFDLSHPSQRAARTSKDRAPGERKPFEKKFENRGFGKKRFEGEREGFKKKTFGEKPGGFRKRDEREFGGEGRPRFKDLKRGEKTGFKKRSDFGSREEKRGFKKPGKPFGKQEKPFAKGKAGSKKTGKAFGKPFGKPGLKKDKPTFGKRPGGFAPPRRKRREKESGDGE